MEPYKIFALSFAPGLLWLAWVFSRTRFRRGPTRLVIRTFLLGALIVAPVIIVEAVLKHYVIGDGEPTGVEEVAFASFVVVGLVEELAKFLVVRASIFRSPYFDEPMSGLIYGAAAALGFASVENFGYAATEGVETLLPRALTATVMHLALAAIWGYALGRRRRRENFGRSPQAFVVALALLAAIVLHGLCDYGVLIQQDYEGLTLLTLAITAASAVLLLRRGARTSLYRTMEGLVLRYCVACRQTNGPRASACSRCNSSLDDGSSTMVCSRCNCELQDRDRYCTKCGVRVSRAPKS